MSLTTEELAYNIILASKSGNALPLRLSLTGIEYVLLYNPDTKRVERVLVDQFDNNAQAQIDALALSIDGKEDKTNKVNTFDIVNTTLYPTIKAVTDYVADLRGSTDGLASLDSNGTIPTTQLPDLAITSTITPTETTIADFATNSANYTFQQGDVIIIDDNGSLTHYLYKGGVKTDVNEYSKLTTSEIAISQVIGLQTALDDLVINLTEIDTDLLTSVESFNVGYVDELGDYYPNNTAYYVTDFIPVSEGLYYGAGLDMIPSSKNGMRYVTFYDANQNVVSGGVDAGTDNYPVNVTIPSNVSYVRVSFREANLNTFRFEKGATRSDNTIKNITQINGYNIEGVNKDVTKLGCNIYNPLSYDEGFYSGSDGVFNTSSSYIFINVLVSDVETIEINSKFLSDDIDIKSTGAYQIAFFDSNNVFISGFDVWTITATIPDNAFYCIVSVALESIPTLTIKTNNEVLTSHGKYVNPFKTTKFIAFGDSTTYGAELTSPESQRWTKLLSDYFGASVLNFGSSGARSEEIAVLSGALTTEVTITNGIIPSNFTSVPLSFSNIDPFRGSNITELSASLIRANGDEFLGHYSESTGYKFYKKTYESEFLGESVGSVELFDFKSDLLKSHECDSIALIGMGINNEGLIASGGQTISDIKQNYRSITSSYSDFYVWGVLDRGLSEIAGTTTGDFIIELEQWLKEEYGSRYIPVRQYLASSRAIFDAQVLESSYVPTQDDLDAVAQNVTPPSFRFAGVHLQELGHKLQAQFMYKWIKNK